MSQFYRLRQIGNNNIIEWLNGQRVGWTVGLTDRQTDRQTDARASCKFTLEGPTLAISMCYKNTGRGRNDQFKTFELGKTISLVFKLDI